MSVPPNQETHTAAAAGDHLCDFCNQSRALLYCRADSAKLCFTCDREVHSTNLLFKKHNRSLLCDSCASSPSSIFCCTESAVLCQNCDWETHNSFRSVHDRRPVEGFNGCPCVSELLGILGLDDMGKKNKGVVVGGGEDDEGLMDMLVWETPSVVSLDDLIVSSDGAGDSGRSFQAMGVPPLPKNRNAQCGKRKEEIISQLRELAKRDPNFSGSFEDLEPIQSQATGKSHLRDSSPGFENNGEPISVPTYEYKLKRQSSLLETNAPKWYSFADGAADEGYPSTFIDSFVDMNRLVPDKDSNIGESTSFANGFQEVQSSAPVDSKTIQVLPKAGMRELNSHERDSAISRYKEKKKTRRYDKHVRYESRKARAESRTRIKGRFAKMDR